MPVVRSGSLKREQIIWDPLIYPRVEHWSAATIERYTDAMESGDVFPPLAVEVETNVLFDGKHRLEAYAKLEVEELAVEFHVVPAGTSRKHYAAELSSRHGDRLSNASLKKLAEEEFEENPHRSAAEWVRGLGITDRTVQRWVKHITDRAEKTRLAQMLHLLQLGWTQEEIATTLGVSQATISVDIKNRQLSDFNIPKDWNNKWLEQESERLNLPTLLLLARALQGFDDQQRFDALDIKIQPYDALHFQGSDDRFGTDAYPGRIPGQLVAHVLHWFTKTGGTILDPMAGGGTVPDVCLAMGRECYAYDVNGSDRIDIIPRNIATEGWPDRIKKADLIFWDPPYFDKKDDDYPEESISRLDRSQYLKFFEKAFADAKQLVKRGTILTFLMSDWNDAEEKQLGIFLWDYADLLRQSGWSIIEHIQVPLSTQQVHPDIVNKFREQGRRARLERYLLVAKA